MAESHYLGVDPEQAQVAVDNIHEQARDKGRRRAGDTIRDMRSHGEPERGWVEEIERNGYSLVQENEQAGLYITSKSIHTYQINTRLKHDLKSIVHKRRLLFACHSVE